MATWGVYGGDLVGKGSIRELIDSYLHTYYEGIENLYRQNIYRLDLLIRHRVRSFRFRNHPV